MDLWKKFKNQKTMVPRWQDLEPEDLRLSSVLLFTGYKAIDKGPNLSHIPFHYLQTELKVRWLHRCIVRTNSVLYLKGLCKFKNAVKSSVQSLSHVWLFMTPWTAAHQASLSITSSQSLLKLMSVESVMPTQVLISNLFYSRSAYMSITISQFISPHLLPLLSIW